MGAGVDVTLSLISACVLVSAFALLRVRGNPKALPLALICVAVCIVVAGLEGRLALREHRWSNAASELLGTDVEVNCQRKLAYAFDISPILGFVPADPKTGAPMKETWLRRDTCDSLAGWDPENPTKDAIRSVHVLAHEAMHMAGERNEARAECFAIQRNSAMAVLLGATPDQARALSTRYREEIHQTLPSEYQSPECGPGKEWDENLVTSPWNFTQE